MRHGPCYLPIMNTQMTVSRRLTSATRQFFRVVAALCLFATAGVSHGDNVTLPEQLIGVTQGFLEFTVEDYLATSQTVGRYEIEVKQLDPRLRMPHCDKDLTASLESPARAGYRPAGAGFLGFGRSGGRAEGCPTNGHRSDSYPCPPGTATNGAQGRSGGDQCAQR